MTARTEILVENPPTYICRVYIVDPVAGSSLPDNEHLQGVPKTRQEQKCLIKVMWLSWNKRKSTKAMIIQFTPPKHCEKMFDDKLHEKSGVGINDP